MLKALRRSHCALSRLLSGAGRAADQEGPRRRLWGALSAAALMNSASGPGFTTLHPSLTPRPGASGGTELSSSSSRAENPVNSPQLGSLSFNLDLLVSLLRQENAEDICVIKVPEEIRYTEFFIVVSGSSTRHLRAMAQYTIKVYKFLKRDSDPHVHIEGKDAEDWMCIDFGSMVVHFMLPATRETYELEKLWTLRSYDEQFSSIPNQSIPADFIYDAETK
uniref:Mitochondrial assembly of ribosomal large subunit protein 1 n=1 Tax=Astyanax mexicanus TaxID=7994 RepID=A0A3B1J2M3_ASTMX